MTSTEQTHCVRLGDEHHVRVFPVESNGEWAVRMPGLARRGFLVTSIYSMAVDWIVNHRYQIGATK